MLHVSVSYLRAIFNLSKFLMKKFDPIRWSQAVACSEFGIHQKTLTGRIKQYGIEPGDDGKFSTKQMASCIYGDISGEKLFKLRAERELLELKLAVERSDLIRVAGLERLWLDITMAIRAVILGSHLSEGERDEIFLKLREIPEAEYRGKRMASQNEKSE